MQSALYIGRFQPFHNGHLDAIRGILSENENIIIVIGSSTSRQTQDNPLSAEEREQLVTAALTEAQISPDRYQIISVPDINDSGKWAAHVDKHVPPYSQLYTGSDTVKECYKKRKNVEVLHITHDLPISATDIRQRIRDGKSWQELVPPAVAKLLKKWEIKARLSKLK